MPLYEYQCDTCGHRFESIQKFSDPPLEQCPKCGAAVRKLQSAPAFQFKGAGWYVTDYAKKDGGSPQKGSDGEAAGGETKPADSKPTDAKSGAGDPAPAAASSSTTPAGASPNPKPSN